MTGMLVGFEARAVAYSQGYTLLNFRNIAVLGDGNAKFISDQGATAQKNFKFYKMNPRDTGRNRPVSRQVSELEDDQL